MGLQCPVTVCFTLYWLLYVYELAEHPATEHCSLIRPRQPRPIGPQAKDRLKQAKDNARLYCCNFVVVASVSLKYQLSQRKRTTRHLRASHTKRSWYYFNSVSPCVCVCVPGGPKMAPFLYALTLSNINRFSKLFHWQNQEKICNNGGLLSLKIPPHLTCVATLPCEMSSVLKATVENKTTSVTTYF